MASRKPKREASKRKQTNDTEGSDSDAKVEKKIRSCSKASCPAKAPICFARAASTCCGNGFTSRWYHVTAGEHFCNECFEYYYRSYRDGYESYTSWMRLWTQYGSSDNGVKAYMTDQSLPFWVQCNLCEKWRSVFRDTEITSKYLKNFVCPRLIKTQSQQLACDNPEDFRVEMAKDIYTWPIHMSGSQFVRSAIYAPFVRDFANDSVGIAPSDTSVHKYPDGIFEVRQFLQPFQYDEDESAAMTLPPDRLSDEEQLYFPEFRGFYVRYYLIIRNTILVLWCLDVKTYVTTDRCMNYINMRGLSRIWLTLHVRRILLFLTLKGYINCGLVQLPRSMCFIPYLENPLNDPVVIIGAGIAGLSAARQLTNLGLKVVVLEAGGNIGGRAVDGPRSAFNTQAQIVIGACNNPVIVMCKQGELQCRAVCESCKLLTDEGEIIDETIDKRIQFHFEAMLDINRQLRKDCDSDTSLLERFTQLHTQFKEESGIRFSKLEESLIKFHISNLEFACGSHLGNISSLYWDQNEDYPQFHGQNILIQDDMQRLVDRLADGIEVVKNCKVTSIDYKGDTITVLGSGEQYKASKVIVTVPLEVLKQGHIQFTPALPDYKQVSLGCGHVEKVLLKFSHPFWRQVIKGTSMFGSVSQTKQGMFDVFYDVSQGEEFILSTFISGDAVNIVRQKTDQEIVNLCVQCLHQMFPKQDIPKLSQYYVSRWYKQEHVGMSYSCIPVNAGANAFTNMEREVEGKLYFAGEATSSQYPQTLTGAYMSGIREAEKIFRSLADII